MASLLTLTEADIYLAGSLLPEILLTVQIPVYPTTDPVYPIHKISTNVDKYRQMSTNIDKYWL